MNELPPGKSGRSALEVAITAAKEAGEILLAHFGATRRIKHKSKGNLVTDVDILSEELVLKLLKDEYPDYNVLSEESKFSSPIAGHTWIVDPLDGTNNYAYGIPFFCINIALVVDKDILLGVTYDPVRGELFQAQKGQGACLNGSVICIPKVDTLQTSLVGLDLGYDEERGKEMLHIVNTLWGQVHCLRLLGSASLGLAYVACGRISLYFHRYLFPWDLASGLLLVTEAGGKVTDWQNRQANLRTQEIIAANRELHQGFMVHLRLEADAKVKK